mmetsp:Transcript_3935/g.10095  ORF Transcript_3935/g.10095 Transcript_3935/m.10095 type:complete len:150 (+) Transcript_3935:23-472(+)
MKLSVLGLRWMVLIGSVAAFSRFPVRMVAPDATTTKAKTVLKKDTVLQSKQAGKVDAAKPKRKTVEELEELPMFKVFLLGDDTYEQEHICKSLMDTVEDMDIKRAEEIHQTAQEAGQALVTILAQEPAEFVVEQLLRKEPMIFSELEEV